ncbi:MAG: class I SAM-dependent methyltransferase [Lachnospiraceae bacterium]|nr:class I SAM-dependent methyltransferase [Lachnospiraceae bacterium]
MTANQESQSNNNNSSAKAAEHIGRVNLDLADYAGVDTYSDGAIEDTLLEIAKDRSEVEFPQIIEEYANWPILYHLSHLRENIVEWLPIDKSMKVLEVGAGCGAITGALARKAGNLVCCDLSLKRSRINAYRHMNEENVVIHVGNFTDVEKHLDTDFDYICLIGVFEYAQHYIESEDPYGDLLKLIGTHLKPGGSIAIAIENRFGMKYWAGCKEDHLGTYFSSVTGYPDGGPARTFTDKKLIEIAEKCGFNEHHMYYPYPDYKFMTDIFSDRRLPRHGELKNNIRNFDRDRLLLFNEKEAFDSVLDEGLFNLYSNSYMLILGPEPEVTFARYSNDRKREYRIVTEMLEIEGVPVLRKRALNEEAAAHLKNMAESYKKLSKRYKGKNCRIKVNKCILSEDGMSLQIEYVKGRSLESMFDELLMSGDTQGFVELFKEYIDRISFNEEDVRITDIDLIFSNILVDGDKWTIIDYEWTTNEVWKPKELGFRAIYCYVLEDERRNKLSLDSIIELLNIKPDEMEDLRESEMKFQKKVTGDYRSLAEIRELIGNRIVTMDAIEGTEVSQTELDMRPQVYEDTGFGFNEEQSYFADGFPFSMAVPRGRQAMRIDPCSAFCIVTIEEITWNDIPIPRNMLKFKCNGKKIGRDTYAFATTDPGFTINLKGLPDQDVNVFNVNMHVTPIDAETAAKIG